MFELLRLCPTLNAARAVRQTFQGKTYLVVPTTLMVQGVLEGNNGPLFYPNEEMARNPHDWNHMPLVGYHPRRNGQAISARDTSVLEKQGLGFFTNAEYLLEAGQGGDGKLRGQSWFDEEQVRRFDEGLPQAVRLLPRLEGGQPIEISTGLRADYEPARHGSSHKGKGYTYVARNYHPDHVAVLPDQVGACSIQDGCGVLINHYHTTVNQGGTMPLTPEQRQQMVAYLTTNCSCWKKPGDGQVLNALSDEILTRLEQQAKEEAAKNAPPAPPVPTNQLLNPAVIDQLADAIKDKLGLKVPVQSPPITVLPPTPPAPEQAAVPVTKIAPAQTLVPAAVPVATPVTANEWLTSAPAEIRAAVEASMGIVQRDKQALVDRLVVNVADPAQRQTLHTQLMGRSLADLAQMVSLIPSHVQAPGAPTPIFSGMPGGVRSALTDNEQADVLDFDKARESYDPKYKKAAKTA